MKRRLCPLVWCIWALAPLLAASAAEDRLTFESLRDRAKALAGQPHAERGGVPEWIRKLTYDQFRLIEFDAANTIWRREGLPFQLQFFHPGFVHDRVVSVHELNAGVSSPIPFVRQLFNYRSLETGEIPPTLGFAGFKILYPLNQSADELGAFLGASYFRLLCKKSAYGLSARGIAVNTAQAGGEEFPRFTEFWVNRPAANAKGIEIFALLEGPSVTGAYRFFILPGAETVTQVRVALFPRQAMAVLGIAPLTSMYWRGENSRQQTDDFRPEVHDSDGLSILTGANEWIWRPLSNPKELRVMSFADDNPRGFGLLQRDRDFFHYEDLEANYQNRPSAWVEPVGAWGKGCVRLVEIPTANEFSDNMVAFWVPEAPVVPGSTLEFEYRVHWTLERSRARDIGFTTATRLGRSTAHEPDLERIALDFDGAGVRTLPAGTPPEPVMWVGDGAKLTHVYVQKIPASGAWRVMASVKPDGTGRPVEMRCFLRREGRPLTETWSYLWQP